MFGSDKSFASLSRLALPAAVALVSIAGIAHAGGPIRLSVAQLDQISAGAILPLPSCGGASGCGSITTTSTSSVVTATDNTGTVKTTSTTGIQVNGQPVDPNNLTGTCGAGCTYNPQTVQYVNNPAQGTSPGFALAGLLIPNGALNGLGQ